MNLQCTDGDSWWLQAQLLIHGEDAFSTFHSLFGQQLLELQAEVRCEQPNASLYTFTGNLVLSHPGQAEEQTVPLSQASLLLRGSSLRNTKFVYGAVIFAGHESKVCHIACAKEFAF